MNDDRLTPSEAHRRLMQMEKEKDVERMPLPNFRVLHSQETVAPEPPPPRQERAKALLRIVPKAGERLKRRCTVVLSSRELYSLLAIMPEDQTKSEWIRQAVRDRLARETPPGEAAVAAAEEETP